MADGDDWYICQKVEATPAESFWISSTTRPRTYIWEIMDRCVDKHLSIPKKELEQIEAQR